MDSLPKHVAKFPACLHGRAQEFLVFGLAVPSILADAEEHLGQRPAGPQQRIGLPGQLAPLLHESVAERYVEVERPLTESFG